LSIKSIRMIVSFQERHGLPLDVDRDGYLFLVRDQAEWREFLAGVELQRSLGVDTRVLSPEEAAEISPGISTEGVIGATFCPEDGIADPSGLTLGYATAARRAGAVIETGVEVTGVDVRGGRGGGGAAGGCRVGAGGVGDGGGAWGGG